jgi:secreted PhoX family phosphatase
MSKLPTQAELIEDDNVSNGSDNRTFQDVLATRFSRRQALRGGLAAAATTSFGASHVALAAKGGQKGPNLPKNKTDVGGLVDFTPVPNAEGNGAVPAISADYAYRVVIPWGDPVDPDNLQYGAQPWDGGNLSAFDPSAMTADQQSERIGIGHDGMGFFPIDGSSDDGMLCINHEFGSDTHVLGKDDPENLEDVRKSQHAHGVSVVRLRRENGVWGVASSPSSRRIHVNTPMTFSGPVAGSELIDDARGNFLGTVNNCANGYTPWGTYFTCEENFNGYFGAPEGPWTPNAAQSRYGFSNVGFGYNWFPFDKRFDLSDEATPNEDNRFGWIVEIDPMNGEQVR